MVHTYVCVLGSYNFLEINGKINPVIQNQSFYEKWFNSGERLELFG